jgi:hypothetical protein
MIAVELSNNASESVFKFLVLMALVAALSTGSMRAASDSVNACEVFGHPEQFDGKTIHLRALYCGLIHNAFLIPYPKCEDAPAWIALIDGSGTTVIDWGMARGHGGGWLLSDMVGVFGQNSNGGYFFKLDSMTVLRKVKPYAIR